MRVRVARPQRGNLLKRLQGLLRLILVAIEQTKRIPDMRVLRIFDARRLKQLLRLRQLLQIHEGDGFIHLGQRKARIGFGCGGEGADRAVEELLTHQRSPEIIEARRLDRCGLVAGRGARGKGR